MIAQRDPRVFAAEDAALLQHGHHLVDERIEATRRDVRHQDEAIAGVALHEMVDLLSNRRRGADE